MQKSIKSVVDRFLKEKCSYETYLKIKYFYRTAVLHNKKPVHGPYIVNVKWNKNHDTYYVLRIASPMVGPLAVARYLLLLYPWAEQKGYIPLVEYGYMDDLERGIHSDINFWEELFTQETSIYKLLEQKEEIIFEDINLISSDKLNNAFSEKMNGRGNAFKFKWLAGNMGKEYYRKWNEIASKCLKLAPCITQIEDSLKYLLGESGETIAVFYRAEFTRSHYNNASEENQKRLVGHPRSPEISQVLELLDEYLRIKEYKYIFLCCDSYEIIEKFRTKYKEKLVNIKRKEYMLDYPSDAGMGSDEIKKIFNKKMLMAQYIPYLQEVYIASKCKYFFGSICSGTLMALIWNGGYYEDVFILPNENTDSVY